jgi:predicted Na+-dependent transporter
MAMSLKGEYVGGLFNVFIGLPFLVAYLASRKAWWAIIPAGVMLSIGLMIILIGILGANDRNGSIGVGVMFLGYAVTFGLLWLRRDLHPADWAKYPAVVMVILAVFMFFSAASINYAWPIILIAGGLLLLYFGFRRKSTDIKM